MKTVYLNARTLNTKEGFHEYVKKAFGFPGYYGGNLDALHDCLGDLTEEYAVVFKGMTNAPAFISAAFEVFSDVAEERGRLYVTTTLDEAEEDV